MHERRGICACTFSSVTKSIYVFGGWTWFYGGKSFDSIEYLNVSSLLEPIHTNIETTLNKLKWKFTNSRLREPKLGVKALSIGDYIILVGGRSSGYGGNYWRGKYYDTVQIYYPSLDLIKDGPPLDEPKAGVGVFLWKGKLCLIRGFEWKTMAKLPFFCSDVIFRGFPWNKGSKSVK